MSQYKRIIYFLITMLIACNMNTKQISEIENVLDFKFSLNVEKVYHEYWKPNEKLAYSYTISKIKTSEKQYGLLTDHLKLNDKYEHPKFKLNWSIPKEIKADWWDPSSETIQNTIYISLQNGWIQTKYENGFIYVLKTLN